MAREALNRDEIIAIPTETVYGLAGNAYKEEVVKKIFALKQRPFFNPLIVHIKSAAFLPMVASQIPEMAQKLADAFWPGPLTLILNKQAHIPDLVTAGKATVAVRVPHHPLTLALLEKLDFPLAAPSANPFGSISPTRAEHVAGYFTSQLALVLDGGPCEKGLESTIIGFENDLPVLFRHGAIAIEEIEKVIGPLQVKTSNDKDPNAPGMLTRHYAPATPTFLTHDINALLKANPGKRIGLLLFKDPVEKEMAEYREVLSKTGSLEEAARNLYAALHRLDQLELDLIIAERFPDHGLGKTINDRLQRAIAK